MKKIIILMILLSLVVIMIAAIFYVNMDESVERYVRSLNAKNESMSNYIRLIHKYPRRYFITKVTHYVYKLSDSLNVSSDLILAVISVESNFNQYAVSNKNAYGMMQLLVPTAQIFDSTVTKDTLLRNWRKNILYGTLYLRDAINSYGYKRGILVYNAGPRVLRCTSSYYNEDYYIKVMKNF